MNLFLKIACYCPFSTITTRVRMPLSDLVTGGPECGPSNPMASFSKRFGQDRGAQMDRFSDNVEGSGSSSQFVSVWLRIEHILGMIASSL
jgi:hypothetical protein